MEQQTSSNPGNSELQTSIINIDGLRGSSACEHPTVERWSVDDIMALFELPFNDLLHQAQLVHREHHEPNAVQVSTLLSIKTGGCSEDCGYCPQAARYHTEVENEPLMKLDDVLVA
ncbi:MAG TPA: biotin synthase BioB, partial [Methylophilus sp.]|nr:biotin synthase BioB [Methylophilus sp.]